MVESEFEAKRIRLVTCIADYRKDAGNRTSIAAENHRRENSTEALQIFEELTVASISGLLTTSQDKTYDNLKQACGELFADLLGDSGSS